jgi:hypothetical protein
MSWTGWQEKHPKVVSEWLDNFLMSVLPHPLLADAGVPPSPNLERGMATGGR